jgi:hypothetical protein
MTGRQEYDRQRTLGKYMIDKTSGFLPCMSVRALRAPVILGSLQRQTGRCAPPTHRSFAAFSSYSKDKNNLPNSGCLLEGPFSFNSTTEARVPGLLSSRPHWVPPPPQLQKSVASPLWIQGGRHTRIRMRGWGVGPIPTMGHTLWHSRPSHRSFADLSGKKSQCGDVSCDINDM